MIGGPKDGQRIDVAAGRDYIVMPFNEDFLSAARPISDEPPKLVELKEVIYRREWIRDFDGTMCSVLVADGSRSPIQRLIAGYNPTTDSAGRRKG